MPTPGLIDWSAGSQGSIDAANIEAARDRHLTEATERKDNHEQMRENTRALMQKNDENDMTLAERAVHHAAWMKNNQDGQYEARMAKMMAIEDAKLTNEYLEADKITRANNKAKADYEQIVANQPLMDRALQTIATQKPANAIVLSRTFAQTFAGNNDPLVLDTMLKLNALSDAGMKEFDTYVNWVIDNAIDDPEVLKKSQTSIVRMADNIITQADPDLREPLGKHFAERLDSYSQRDDQRKAREHEMEIESYMEQTGVSREIAVQAMSQIRRDQKLEITTNEERLKNKARASKLDLMEEQILLSQQEGSLEAKTQDSERQKAYDIAYLGSKLDSNRIYTATRLAQIAEERQAIENSPPGMSLGEMSASEILEKRIFSQTFVGSDVQDQTIIEINARVAELEAKMKSADANSLIKYKDARTKLKSLKREISYYGGVHNVPKGWEQEFKMAKNNIREVKKSVGIFGRDEQQGIERLHELTKYLDSIYTPDSTGMDRLSYEEQALRTQLNELQNAYDVLYMDYSAGSRAEEPEIIEP